MRLVVHGVEYLAVPVPGGMEAAGYVAMADDNVIGRTDSLGEAQDLCERAIPTKSRRTSSRGPGSRLEK